jgi:membrane protease subunit HflK
MAWNEPGGNKNDDDGSNQKPNNPWGSGGNKPPDLEKIITDFIKNIKSALGFSNKPSKGGISAFPIILILLAFVGYAVWTSAHKIGPSERGVVLTFGKYSKTMQPGLNFTWPKPVSEVYKVDVNNLYSVGEDGEMLTEDKNLVYLEFTIQYRIKEAKVKDYLFMLVDPHATVKHAAESAVRQVVGTNTMDHLLNESRELAITDIVKVLQTMLDSYNSGIQVTNFNFKEVHPPIKVKEAFDDVVKAREDAKTFINEANEYARQEVPLAEGDALKIIQEAEAYKQSIIAKSEGEAQQFNLVREQYELAPDVTKERLYLETMEDVFANTSKVLIDSESSNNMMYLPLDQMLKNSNKPKKESVYLGTTTVTSPTNQKNSSYQRSSSNTRTGRERRQ